MIKKVFGLLILLCMMSSMAFWAPTNSWIEDVQEANLNVNSSVFWNGIQAFYELNNTHFHSYDNLTDTIWKKLSSTSVQLDTNYKMVNTTIFNSTITSSSFFGEDINANVTWELNFFKKYRNDSLCFKELTTGIWGCPYSGTPEVTDTGGLVGKGSVLSNTYLAWDVNTTTYTSLEYNHPFTIEVWHKVTCTSSSGVWFNMRSNNVDTIKFEDYYGAVRLVLTDINGAGSGNIIKQKTPNVGSAECGQLKYYVVTYDGSNDESGINIYFDGELQVMSSSTNVPIQNSLISVDGSISHVTYGLETDYVRVIDKEASSDEVVQLFKRRFADIGAFNVNTGIINDLLIADKVQVGDSIWKNTAGTSVVVIGSGSAGGNYNGSNARNNCIGNDCQKTFVINKDNNCMGSDCQENSNGGSTANDCMGGSCMQSSAGATYSSSMGLLSLSGNSGSTNQCMGYQCISVGDGGGNQAFGHRAMYVYTGSGSKCLGSYCIGTGSGSYNVCMGDGCMQTSGTGTGNVCFGHDCMDSMSGSANYNVGLGYETGKKLVDADYNILLGMRVGKTNIPDVSYQFVVGHNDPNIATAFMYGIMSPSPFLRVNADLNVSEKLSVYKEVFFKNNTVIQGDLNVTGIIQSDNPIFAEMNLYDMPRKNVTKYNVTNGTVTSGNLASLQSVDNNFLVVQETGKFAINLNFTTMSAPQRFRLVGYYEGNPAHEVEVQIYNFTSRKWVEIRSVTKDIPSSASSQDYAFSIVNYANFSYNNVSRIKIIHTSTAVSSHYMRIDYASLLVPTFTFTNAGVYYNITGLIPDDYNLVTINSSLGSISVQQKGWYNTGTSVSFIGSENSEIECTLFKDGISTDISFTRAFGNTSIVGSASAIGIVNATPDKILHWKCKSSIPNAWMGVINGHWTINKLN